MNSLLPEEMQAIDTNCRYFGLLPLQLMENAGAELAREIKNFAVGKKIAIVAGKGNNGGDAFVAARHLSGFYITIYLLGKSRDISTYEAKKNWDILKSLNFELVEIHDVADMLLHEHDLVLDAIFGTGVRGTIKGLEAQAIDAINSCQKPVVSVDCPSGLGTNKFVRSNLTITFHRPKTGLVGEAKVVEIGIPSEVEFFIGPGDLALINKRSENAHKGDNGRILVIGGGPYTGAPALTGMAALRAGADIVTIATPSRISHIVAGFSPNLIIKDLAGDHLSPKNLAILMDLIPRHDVVVLGMGLGRDPETIEALSQIIPKCNKVVIDADALLPNIPLKGLITPHAGEFKRISGISLSGAHQSNYSERIEPLKRYAKDMGLVVLLKGRVDLITDGEIVRGNTTGNAGMTVGGTGDVLAGITAAFYSRNSALRAAVAAAFVNGRAGDLVQKEKDYGLVATDLLEKIPQAMIMD
jgi:ADP-dependent NAD(P)H-hydrate dehydratase / NAD(P)H-hydrate epimerase